jgi:hypothetical protein
MSKFGSFSQTIENVCICTGLLALGFRSINPFSVTEMVGFSPDIVFKPYQGFEDTQNVRQVFYRHSVEATSGSADI